MNTVRETPHDLQVQGQQIAVFFDEASWSSDCKTPREVSPHEA